MKRSSTFAIISVLLVIVLLTIGGCTKTTSTTTQTTTKTQTTTPVQTTTTQTSNQTIPVVSSTTPDLNSTGVHINDEILATFSEAMDPSTINIKTFTLWQGSTPLDGVVTYYGTTAVLTPAVDLAKNTIYTVKITTGVKDLTGVAMAAEFDWSFTTGEGDTIAPMVVGTFPSFATDPNIDDPNALSTSFPINNDIVAVFNDDMDPSTINTTTFVLMQGTTLVNGTVIYDGVHTADFNPADNLVPNTQYTAKITTGVTDLAGNPMAADFIWSFTTGPAQTSVPKVISTIPSAGATGVPINNAITAVFSEAMDPLTITAVTFSLWQGTISVPGTVDYDGINSTAVFTPSDDLVANVTYTVKISASVHDLSGIPMASDISWSFTTGTADTSVPSVVSMSPADGATNVSVNSTITITFSEAMDPASLVFSLQKGTTVVPCTMTWSDDLKTVTLKPVEVLTSNTVYTATFYGATDLAGISGDGDSWSFTTAP